MLNISFSGCGFLGFYHQGVIRCFRDNAPKLAESFVCVGGSSGGSLAALLFVTGCAEEKICEGFLETTRRIRARRWGPFSLSIDIHADIEKFLEETLPEDAHVLASGRLYVSLTAVGTGKNELVSNFNSRQELISVCGMTFSRFVCLPLVQTKHTHACTAELPWVCGY